MTAEGSVDPAAERRAKPVPSLTAEPPERHGCGVCGRTLPRDELRPAALVSGAVAAVLSRSSPGWNATGWVCRDDLRKARQTTIEEMIREERGELSALDESVLASLAESETVTENPEEVYGRAESFGDRLADDMASFAGSWTFISIFCSILVLWIAANSVALFVRPFDPYPYILLNLILSCIAAIQAPLIMMSQKRQEAKDRLRSENDYRVNLKAELEIRRLHEKIDQHLLTQWEHLSRIQEAQLELVREMRSRG
ncbi:DUF1003 domain-containing protein [Jiella sonneratiae]|uniref:DUF1003 domain-containing protein n=1 Tax=Jiella sonneratiae TaxID=2816856 RepID=A0ABS3J1P3_9HYPH|nr:DUF1003 domain-containing protein [Jiella sonneratiae]MBO0903599.1 DUF1003 domain-containing protein [Jiella sonneratiae]